eukprot:gene11624-14196_t
MPIHGDVALIRAERGDRWGNLTYRMAARNFGPVMAMAAKKTVATVHEIVELGGLDPEAVITPGIFQPSRVAQKKQPELLERHTMTYQKRTKDQLAARVAQDIPEGATVNLGIGQPTLVANHIPSSREVLLHSENGILGMGPAPAEGQEDYDLINAGKQPVTLLPGGAYFHHADSFALVRQPAPRPGAGCTRPGQPSARWLGRLGAPGPAQPGR